MKTLYLFCALFMFATAIATASDWFIPDKFHVVGLLLIASMCFLIEWKDANVE